MAHCNSAVCECVPLRRLANATGGGDPYVNFFEHSTLQASLGRLRGGKAGIREFPQVLRSLFCRFSPARAATYSSTECSTENAMCSGRMTDSLYYDDYAANLEASSRPESLRVRGAPGALFSTRSMAGKRSPLPWLARSQDLSCARSTVQHPPRAFRQLHMVATQ